MPLPIGVLVSGTGTNLQAILDAIGQRRLDACVRIVISNNPQAQALRRAERAADEDKEYQLLHDDVSFRA